MKKLNILLLVALLSIFKAFSSEKIVVNGIEREYLKFTPENLMAESPYSILVLLHYNGAKASDFADLCRASTLASLYNTVVLVPQALDEQDSDVLSLLTLAESLGEYPGMSKTAVWGAGVSVAPSELIPSDYMPIFTMLYPQMAATGKVEFNKSIDDIAFINAIIEDTRENNFANSAQVFLAGSSMGGAMTYKYAYSQESQADAIAVIAGFVGAEVDNSSPLNIPVCVFHSEDDEVFLYQGSTLNKSVPDFIDKIVSENGCGQNLSSQFPDLASDGIEVNLTKYNCDVNKIVWFYILKRSRHSDYVIFDYVTVPYILRPSLSHGTSAGEVGFLSYL